MGFQQIQQHKQTGVNSDPCLDYVDRKRAVAPPPSVHPYYVQDESAFANQKANANVDSGHQQYQASPTTFFCWSNPAEALAHQFGSQTSQPQSRPQENYEYTSSFGYPPYTPLSASHWTYHQSQAARY
jgi:hypothetical protein